MSKYSIYQQKKRVALTTEGQWLFHTHLRVLVQLIYIEDNTLTVEYRTAINIILLYFVSKCNVELRSVSFLITHMVSLGLLPIYPYPQTGKQDKLGRSFQLSCTYTVNPVHAVTPIKQSSVLKGHLFIILSQNI